MKWVLYDDIINYVSISEVIILFSILHDESTEDIFFTHRTDVHIMKYPHTHTKYELYFCSSDIPQKQIINGAEYKCDQPCIVISSPYTVHSMSPSSANVEEFERFVIYFTEKIINSFAPHLIHDGIKCKNSGLLFKLTPEQAKALRELILTVDPQGENETGLLLVLLLNKLLCMCPIEDAECVGISSFYIQDVLQYISNNFHEQITSDTIAYNFAVSRSKLDRDFKRFTGITVHDFIKSCRIDQAKHLLLEHGDKYLITEIAKMCGFQSETYFYPFFKKHVGMTTAEYIRSIRSKTNKKGE